MKANLSEWNCARTTPGTSHPRLSKKAKKQNLNYESEHPFQSAVEQTVRKWQNSKFSTKSILIDSELRTDATITQKDMNDVAAILRGLGYVRDKNQTTNSITKERSRLWSLAQPTHSWEVYWVPLNRFNKKGSQLFYSHTHYK